MNEHQIEFVADMQKYIIENYNKSDFSLEELYKQVNYSKRHADRCFKELIGMTPTKYLNHIRLSDSADMILNSNDSILSIALDSKFNSHEGYIKAFKNKFHILPSEFKSGRYFIPLFHYYPLKNSCNYIFSRKDNQMNKNNYCFITLVHKEKRKLIFLRSKNATEYFSFCKEAGCDWEGLLNSNPQKSDTAALLSLPEFLLKDGYGKIACGIEVPINFDGEIPDGYEIAELPECDMLFFQSQKYDNEEDYSKMISQVFNAVDNFDYKSFGCLPDNSLAPSFNFGAEKDTGARFALPIRKINQNNSSSKI